MENIFENPTAAIRLNKASAELLGLSEGTLVKPFAALITVLTGEALVFFNEWNCYFTKDSICISYSTGPTSDDGEIVFYKDFTYDCRKSGTHRLNPIKYAKLVAALGLTQTNQMAVASLR